MYYKVLSSHYINGILRYYSAIISGYSVMISYEINKKSKSININLLEAGYGPLVFEDKESAFRFLKYHRQGIVNPVIFSCNIGNVLELKALFPDDSLRSMPRNKNKGTIDFLKSSKLNRPWPKGTVMTDWVELISQVFPTKEA